MQTPTSPSEIARLALIQLAQRKIAPTPDHFRSVYDEISGAPTVDSDAVVGRALQNLLLEAGRQRPKYQAAAKALAERVAAQDSAGLEALLRGLMPLAATEGVVGSWSSVLSQLLRQLEVRHRGVTLTKKREGLERVLVNFEHDSDQLLQKIQALVASWGEAQQEAATLENSPEEPTSMPVQADAPFRVVRDLWRDLLLKTLELGLMSQIKYLPQLTRTAETLVGRAKAAQTEKEVAKLRDAMKPFWLDLEMHSDAQFRLHEELLHLLRLVVDNMGELVEDDKWLYGQAAMIRDIIAKPLDIQMLYDAESSLKELTFKQGKLKHGLTEARDTLKQMAATFVGRLAEISESTGEYHQKVADYQHKIRATEDITELNVLLDHLMEETSAMQIDALRSHEALQASQQKATEAEKRIQALTAELDHISEVAHQDYLTGALNRRGMEEALTREFSRADRSGGEVCLAMMDIDHFKKLNDTLGHEAGDIALMHLAKVTRSALRPTDVLARYGGEEFVIILPQTSEAAGMQVMMRVQRELTRQFFLHDNERVLITFSAGVAQRQPGEVSEEVMRRADMALYQAKQSGRNRVLGAEVSAE